jgi:hypothetical protein
MDKLKPFQKVASRFGVSQESAKYFLGQVQKSFRKEKPPHTLILDVIETHGFTALPEPYDVAVLMSESGIWSESLNSPPPLLVEEE